MLLGVGSSCPLGPTTQLELDGKQTSDVSTAEFGDSAPRFTGWGTLTGIFPELITYVIRPFLGPLSDMIFRCAVLPYRLSGPMIDELMRYPIEFIQKFANAGILPPNSLSSILAKHGRIDLFRLTFDRCYRNSIDPVESDIKVAAAFNQMDMLKYLVSRLNRSMIVYYSSKGGEFCDKFSTGKNGVTQCSALHNPAVRNYDPADRFKDITIIIAFRVPTARQVVD